MNNEFKEIEDIEVYNYEATRKNLDSLLAKYRTYKSKKTTIEERIKNSIDLDNLGIFSSRKSDPTYNKVEQLERINNFIDTVDKVIKLNKNKLSKDEYFQKLIIRLLGDGFSHDSACFRAEHAA